MSDSRERLRFPTDAHRTTILGRTGSGKTVFSAWLLSTRNFDQMPWVIFDYKRDALIADIEALGAREIGLRKPPVKPGLYICRPDPKEPEAVDGFLDQVWRNGRCGLFGDEGFMIPQKQPYKAFDRILTQGRSLQIPVIMLYQRPVWMSQFQTSQSDFFAVFHLLKRKDREIAGEYVGETVAPDGTVIDVNYRLPDHYCLWYDVGSDRATVLQPSPGPDLILETFEHRLAKPRKRGLFS